MDSDDWKEFQKKGKEIRRGRQQRHGKAVIRFAKSRGLSHTFIQEWQIRISDGVTTMDIFPQAKRYHNITKKKRGDYHNLNGFLNSIFGNATRKSGGKDSTRVVD